ncbi:MAG TPA: grasp-with-spasm system SPASM domain peptide maturase [Flavisolibacter sp.]|nr:grasp-with-spasm system SPASM domain peptide maturase [Flavisolibacter sp.]
MKLRIADQYFLLHSCCKPVKGAVRSIICDLQRQDFLFIPNEFADIFLRQEELQWDELKREFSQYSNFEIEFLQCIDALIHKEYAFYTTEPHLFPELNETLDTPESISNCIIDIDGPIQFEIERFINDLSQHLCFSVHLRFFSLQNTAVLYSIVEKFTDSTIRHIEITLPYCTDFEELQAVRNFIADFPKCKRMTIYGTASRNEEYSHYYYQIVYTEFQMTAQNCCGYISPHYFRVNNSKFFEAKKFNTCLHKKVSVDKEGRVCNCPSLQNKFGRYNDLESISDVLENKAFQLPAQIKKDQITVCKDCEFRYICHDCRAFVTDMNDQFSKPLHCKYNPYEAKWN